MNLFMFHADSVNTHFFRNKFNRVVIIIQIPSKNQLSSKNISLFSITYTISQFSKRPDGLVT